jgi:hypothetical protein
MSTPAARSSSCFWSSFFCSAVIATSGLNWFSAARASSTLGEPTLFVS